MRQDRLTLADHRRLFGSQPPVPVEIPHLVHFWAHVTVFRSSGRACATFAGWRRDLPVGRAWAFVRDEIGQGRVLGWRIQHHEADTGREV